MTWCWKVCSLICCHKISNWRGFLNFLILSQTQPLTPGPINIHTYCSCQLTHCQKAAVWVQICVRQANTYHCIVIAHNTQASKAQMHRQKHCCTSQRSASWKVVGATSLWKRSQWRVVAQLYFSCTADIVSKSLLENCSSLCPQGDNYIQLWKKQKSNFDFDAGPELSLSNWVVLGMHVFYVYLWIYLFGEF